MKASVLPVLALLAVAGCSGASPGAGKPPASAVGTHTVISASAACQDFAKWFLSTNLPDHPGTFKAGNMALLTRAVSESPSGTLYQDMSGVEQTVDQVLTGQIPGSAGIGTITTAAYQAETDCQSINPG